MRFRISGPTKGISLRPILDLKTACFHYARSVFTVKVIRHFGACGKVAGGPWIVHKLTATFLRLASLCFIQTLDLTTGQRFAAHIGSADDGACQMREPISIEQRL